MNKFGLMFGLLSGIAGSMVFTRYIAAKKSADIRKYEEMDSGFYFDDEELPF